MRPAWKFARSLKSYSSHACSTCVPTDGCVTQTSTYPNAFGPSVAVSLGWKCVVLKVLFLLLSRKIGCRMLPVSRLQYRSSPEPDHRRLMPLLAGWALGAAGASGAGIGVLGGAGGAGSAMSVLPAGAGSAPVPAPPPPSPPPPPPLTPPAPPHTPTP